MFDSIFFCKSNPNQTCTVDNTTVMQQIKPSFNINPGNQSKSKVKKHQIKFQKSKFWILFNTICISNRKIYQKQYTPGNQSTPKRSTEQYTKENLRMNNKLNWAKTNYTNQAPKHFHKNKKGSLKKKVKWNNTN